jgi:arsenate reductase
MAEGYLNARYGDRYSAFSAGTASSAVHPMAIEVMREIGIDIIGQRSKTLGEFFGQSFDIVVTVCDRAQGICPFFPGAGRTIHHSVPDPSRYDGSREDMRKAFRDVRDEIIRWIDREFGPE